MDSGVYYVTVGVVVDVVMNIVVNPFMVRLFMVVLFMGLFITPNLMPTNIFILNRSVDYCFKHCTFSTF